MTSSSENNDPNRKQQEIEDKENEIVENLDNVSLKEVKESKKEANLIGDSDKE
jgi:hypothetical protein